MLVGVAKGDAVLVGVAECDAVLVSVAESDAVLVGVAKSDASLVGSGAVVVGVVAVGSVADTDVGVTSVCPATLAIPVLWLASSPITDATAPRRHDQVPALRFTCPSSGTTGDRPPRVDLAPVTFSAVILCERTRARYPLFLFASS